MDFVRQRRRVRRNEEGDGMSGESTNGVPLSETASGGAAADNALAAGRSKSVGGRRDAQFEEAIDQIRQALQGLRFGEVSVIVQDGVVVQLERRERKRLRSSQP
jgi:hypothetical protein